MPNITNIPAPRVPFIDERTGLISQEWYRFFLNLFTLTGSGQSDATIVDILVAPASGAVQESQIAEIQKQLDNALPTVQQIAEIQKQLNDAALTYVGQLEQVSELYKRLQALELAPGVDAQVTPTAQDLGLVVHAAASKTTPVDADELPIADSATSFTLKKLTWANLKATLATWINGNLIAAKFTSLGVNTASILAGAQSQITKNSNANYATTYAVGTDAAAVVLRDLSPVATYANCFNTLLFGAGDSGSGWSAITNVRTASQTAELVVMTANGASNPVERIRIVSTGIQVPGGTTLITTKNALTNGAGAGIGTLTTAPTAGNPTKWIGINDNGTIRYIPAW